jgi:hypothetical protein
MHSLLMEVTKHLIYWCTLCWWRQHIASFIDALIIDGSSKSPHLLMHSSLMEATNHLIYWCTHHWWRQQITSFIDALFVDGGNKSPHLLMHWGSSLMEATHCLIILSPTKLRRDIVMLPSVRPSVRLSILLKHPCEHSRINILQWILTKLGTYLVLKRI